jgi:NhaP-type Na+/H+ or K+/H+ antiporter
MHDHQLIVLGALLVLFFGLFSKISERSPISGPMVFVGVGVILSLFNLEEFELHLDTDMVKFVAELTLIIILFVDGSLIKITRLKETLSGIPGRLLLIGLPITAILGSLAAWLIFPEWGIWSILLLALILSPTDAALGQAVVKSDAVPEKIRRSISIESGLNDGMVLPPILVCIAVLTSGAAAFSGDGHWVKYIIMQLTLGPLFGFVVGHFGGRLIEYANSKDWMNHTFQQLASFALAILAFSVAELFHGNGFIAAFVAGLTLGVSSHDVRERIQEFGEAQGQLFSLFVFLLVGLTAIPVFSAYWTMSAFIYAILSLTVIRVLPVMLSLMGTGLDNYSKVFIGWFGPRGIASVLYLLIVVGDMGESAPMDVLAVIVLTVLLSVFAHGISAVFMAKKFSN